MYDTFPEKTLDHLLFGSIARSIEINLWIVVIVSFGSYNF